MGCGGAVTLLFEPAETPEYDALMHALEASLLGESLTVATWLPGSSGAPGFARAIFSEDGEVVFASQRISQEELAAFASPGARFSDAVSATKDIPSVFIERLVPPQRLVVFGAGDDAKPLVSMAALLGWTVLVADGRAHMARPERFPEADRLIALSPGEIETLNLTDADAVILMTHSYEQDRAWLAAVLPVAPVYFGILGAKHRSSLLVSEAAAMTGLSLAECCDRIFAPVGLDLGGDGPEAIALAVISEAHARCMGRLGSSLRLTAADVSAQIERRAQPPLCALNPPVGY
jgi:xanthine/CO dehydrogenase XdhC/CoxF family maturation factor